MIEIHVWDNEEATEFEATQKWFWKRTKLQLGGVIITHKLKVSLNSRVSQADVGGMDNFTVT